MEGEELVGIEEGGCKQDILHENNLLLKIEKKEKRKLT